MSIQEEYTEYIKNYLKISDKHVWGWNNLPSPALKESELQLNWQKIRNLNISLLMRESNKLNNINDNIYNFILCIYLKDNEFLTIHYLEDLIFVMNYYTQINAIIFYTSKLHPKMEILSKNNRFQFIKLPFNLYMYIDSC